jgi:hypothetical protein
MLNANESWLSKDWLVIAIDNNTIAFYRRSSQYELEFVTSVTDPRLSSYTDMNRWVEDMVQIYSEYFALAS